MPVAHRSSLIRRSTAAYASRQSQVSQTPSEYGIYFALGRYRRASHLVRVRENERCDAVETWFPAGLLGPRAPGPAGTVLKPRRPGVSFCSRLRHALRCRTAGFLSIADRLISRPAVDEKPQGHDPAVHIELVHGRCSFSIVGLTGSE